MKTGYFDLMYFLCKSKKNLQIQVLFVLYYHGSINKSEEMVIQKCKFDLFILYSGFSVNKR